MAPVLSNGKKGVVKYRYVVAILSNFFAISFEVYFTNAQYCVQVAITHLHTCLVSPRIKNRIHRHKMNFKKILYMAPESGIRKALLCKEEERTWLNLATVIGLDFDELIGY